MGSQAQGAAWTPERRFDGFSALHGQCLVRAERAEAGRRSGQQVGQSGVANRTRRQHFRPGSSGRRLPILGQRQPGGPKLPDRRVRAAAHRHRSRLWRLGAVRISRRHRRPPRHRSLHGEHPISGPHGGRLLSDFLLSFGRRVLVSRLYRSPFGGALDSRSPKAPRFRTTGFSGGTVSRQVTQSEGPRVTLSLTYSLSPPPSR